MKKDGRLFYIGSGTSGRLGIVDASECPPTYGVDKNKVIGIIAGGDKAIRTAVEFAEDDKMQGWLDLQEYNIGKNDFVIGISASGNTPYVVEALSECRKNNISTACITSNLDTPLAKTTEHPLEVIVGAEIITGSTRMKSGTAQKLILNMISTTVMTKLGHVVDNKMVDMQLNNNKLVERGIRFIQDATDYNEQEARSKLLELGSVRKVVDQYKK